MKEVRKPRRRAKVRRAPRRPMGDPGVARPFDDDEDDAVDIGGPIDEPRGGPVSQNAPAPER
jgi:hypothetical protein